MIFFLFSLRMVGQSSFQSVSYIDADLYAGSFSSDDYGHKIISSLALTNAKGLKWVYVKFKGRVLIQTETSSDGHLFAYSKLIDYKISGEDHFRDFEIDSLLLPTSITGRLQFKDNGTTIAEIPVEILLSGGVIDLQSVGLPIDSLRDLFVRIEVDEISYSKEKYDNYIKTTRLINTYYAYSEILKYVVARYSGSGIGSNLALSQLLIGWHELTRVKANLDNNDFIEILHLDKNDPLGFLKSFTKFKRLEKRATTLLHKKLDSKPVISISEKNEYCNEFVDISTRYSELSKKHQPYISSGFLEIVKIQPREDEFQIISDATKTYDVFNKLNLPSTVQTIYNQFIDLAETSYDESDLVLTLDLLYNASVISTHYTNIEVSDKYSIIYVKTLDGLLSSYLQVAIMAYRAENFDMADSYYSKAQDIFKLNLENIEGGQISSDSFLRFINQQIDLAYEFLNDEKFREGLKMVVSAQSMSNDTEHPYESKNLDSAFTIGYLGVYQEKLDSVGELIENVKIDKARTALEIAGNFSSDNKNYINGDKEEQLRAYAHDLYNLYILRGERLMKSKEPEKALFNFIEAQTINNTYLHEPKPALDSLIYLATVPVILDLINKAEFETWANRMDEAEKFASEAKALQLEYKQEDNHELIAAFLILDEKMVNRNCVNLSNECFGIQKKVENRIKNKKYYEADYLIQTALNKIGAASACEIDNSIFIEYHQKYQPAFEYASLLHKALNSFNEGEYSQCVEEYNYLMQTYDDNKILTYGIEKPDLKHLVLQNPSQAFVRSCVDYYVKGGQYQEAYDYLVLAKEQNYGAKDFKLLQESVGRGIAAEDNNSSTDKSEKVEEYVKGEKWLRYFRNAYLKSN